MDRRQNPSRSRRWYTLATAVAIVFCQGASSQGQQVVKAPGSQVPGAPLPRYVYNVVAADFAVGAGHPLIKSKFNLYDPVGPTTQQFDANLAKMRELKVDTYRLELGWGRQRTGMGLHLGVGGTADQLTYNFEPLDHIVRQLRSVDVQFLAAYGYTPTPLQDPALKPRYGEGDLKRKDTTPPKDPKKFGEAAAAFAKHHKQSGLPIGIHEIWNEPDGTYGFFSGTEAEYQQLYKAGVEAIRSVDPDAVVAGPAADHHMLWNQTFIDFVHQNKLPLDHYTFHEYGSGELAVRQVDRAAASLNRYPSLNTTTLSLDEWHDGECCDWCHDDARNRAEGAPELLHDFNLLLAKPELSSVSWAWWLDPAGRGNGCMGLLHSDGRRKAVYNAWKLYAKMPVDRVKVTTEGPLEAMASTTEHHSALLIWNRGAYDRRLDVRLNHLPIPKGTVRVYRVDAQHGSPLDGAPDDISPLETYETSGTEWSWVDGSIPRYGVLYFEVTDGAAAPESPTEVAKVVRINRYYPARGKTASYADFDRRTWIARLGMADSHEGDQEIGALVDDLPDALDVRVLVDGTLRKLNANSLLGVRLDYRVDGKYASSVLVHGPYKGVDLYDSRRTAVFPWGTKRQADRAHAVPDLGQFRVPVRQLAPQGWKGQAQLTFLMQNAGEGARAKIIVRRVPPAASSASNR